MTPRPSAFLYTLRTEENRESLDDLRLWDILLQIEQRIDRPIFDWANTFFTGYFSKKRRYVFEDFFYFAIYWEIGRVEKLRIWVKTIFLKTHNSCSI